MQSVLANNELATVGCLSYVDFLYTNITLDFSLSTRKPKGLVDHHPLAEQHPEAQPLDSTLCTVTSTERPSVCSSNAFPTGALKSSFLFLPSKETEITSHNRTHIYH